MTSKYGAYALRAGLAGLYARMGMHMPTRPSTHMHARTRKHAHTDQFIILIAFPQQQWFHERVLVLRYTYIASLVTFKLSTICVFVCVRACVLLAFLVRLHGCLSMGCKLSSLSCLWI